MILRSRERMKTACRPGLSRSSNGRDRISPPAPRFLIGCAFAAILPSPAQAQSFEPLLGVEIPFDISRGRNVSVTEREKPELAPLGIRTGGFLVYPQVTGGIGHTDNVFGAAQDAEGDMFLTLDPRLRVSSNWSRHELNLRATGTLKRFAEETIKNETGYTVGADGRLDVHGDSNVYAALNYTKTYESQYSGNFPANAAASVPLRRVTGILRGTYTGGRTRVIANADVNRLDYGDTEAIGGGLIDQDYRDRTVARGSGRVEYAVTPDVAGFVQYSYSHADYRLKEGVIPDRSSSEHRLLGGVTFDLSALVRAAAGVGYVTRNYKNPLYPSISGIAADVRLEWFASPITTVSVNFRRDVEDAILLQSPGFLSSRGGIRVDHELLRNLVLNARADVERAKYKDISRRDRLFRIGAGAQYTPFRRVVVEPDLDYISRKSSGDFPGQEFNEFRATLRLTYRI